MLLSVIVPTRNRLPSLKRLMKSFELSDIPPDCAVEVLAIDNNSSDGSDLSWRKSQADCQIQAAGIARTKTGKSERAQFRACHCQREIVLIIDDDVTVGSKVLLKHLEGYQKASFGALQGRILPGTDPDGKSADLAKLREYNIPYIDYGEEMREIRGLTGTNMSFKREVFEKVGFFDARLGPGAAGFSEDTEYSIRIRKAGFKIGYTPQAVVYHELNPNRYGREYNRAVEYRKGLSRSIYRRDSILFRVIPNLAANCVRYGLYRLLSKTQKAIKPRAEF